MPAMLDGEVTVRAWWRVFRNMPMLIVVLDKRLKEIEEMRLPALESVVYRGSIVHRLPVPDAWSIEQAWEVYKRQELDLDGKHERVITVLADTKGNILKWYE